MESQMGRRSDLRESQTGRRSDHMESQMGRRSAREEEEAPSAGAAGPAAALTFMSRLHRGPSRERGGTEAAADKAQ